MKKLSLCLFTLFLIIFCGCAQDGGRIGVCLVNPDDGGDSGEIEELKEYYENSVLYLGKQVDFRYTEDDVEKQKLITIDDITVDGEYVETRKLYGVATLKYEENTDDYSKTIRIDKKTGRLFYYFTSSKSDSDNITDEPLLSEDSFREIAVQYIKKYCDYSDDLTLKLDNMGANSNKVTTYQYNFVWTYNGIQVSDGQVVIGVDGSLRSFYSYNDPLASLFIATPKIDSDKYYELVNNELNKVLSKAEGAEYELVYHKFSCADVTDKNEQVFVFALYNIRFNENEAELFIEIPIELIT